MKYAVVIPAKDEQTHIGRTLASLEAQTVQPVRCIVVDNGSSDRTAEIVDEVAKRVSFLERATFGGGTGAYTLGGHVVRVFNEGRRLLDAAGVEYDVVVKLDADTSFEPDFARTILRRMEEQNLGIASGTPYCLVDGRRVYEYSPEWHTQGQFKFYRRSVLDAMGGLPESLGWDTADNIRAVELGWGTRAFRDIYYEMDRPVGGKSSLRKGRKNHGRGAYLLGYDLPYFALRAAHDVVRPPIFTGALSMAEGYVEAALSGQERILSRSQQRVLRRLLWGSLGRRLLSRDFALLQRFR